MNLSAIRGLFAVTALYDGMLGLLFLIAPNWVYTQYAGLSHFNSGSDKA